MGYLKNVFEKNFSKNSEGIFSVLKKEYLKRTLSNKIEFF